MKRTTIALLTGALMATAATAALAQGGAVAGAQARNQGLVGRVAQEAAERNQAQQQRQERAEAQQQQQQQLRQERLERQQQQQQQLRQQRQSAQAAPAPGLAGRVIQRSAEQQLDAQRQWQGGDRDGRGPGGRDGRGPGDRDGRGPDSGWNNNGGRNPNWNNNPNWNGNRPGWNEGRYRDRDRGRRDYDRRYWDPWIRSPQIYGWIGPSWRTPPGYYSYSWRYGDTLPWSWYTPSYYLNDYWRYGLPMPPIGMEWVRIGRDAVLVDVFTGRVYQVVSYLFR
jgi:hypothetical protein